MYIVVLVIFELNLQKDYNLVMYVFCFIIDFSVIFEN